MVVIRFMSASGRAPFLGYFGEEMFKSRGSDIDEHADWLIRIIFETVDRAGGNKRPGTGRSRYRVNRDASLYIRTAFNN
jgi:hypothetical protein